MELRPSGEPGCLLTPGTSRLLSRVSGQALCRLAGGLQLPLNGLLNRSTGKNRGLESLSQLVCREEAHIVKDEQLLSLARFLPPPASVMLEPGTVRLLGACFSPSLGGPSFLISFLPAVPSHRAAGLQVLRDLRLPHLLLHLYRAGSGLTQVSTCGSPWGCSRGVPFPRTQLY